MEDRFVLKLKTLVRKAPRETCSFLFNLVNSEYVESILGTGSCAVLFCTQWCVNFLGTRALGAINGFLPSICTGMEGCV